jgi:transposase
MGWKTGRPYAQDLRDRVLAWSDAGIPVGKVAATLRVGPSYVSKVLSRRRETGEIGARPQRCHVPPKLAHLYGEIRGRTEARPDATLAELKEWLLETHGVSASRTLLCETLALLGLTLKKRPSTRPSKTAPTSPGRAGSGWPDNRNSIPGSSSS